MNNSLPHDEKRVKWYEVWAGYAHIPPNIFLLWEDESGSLEVFSARENEIIRTFDQYEDAMHWLTEDEYTLVDGRMTDDETWVPIKSG